MPQNTVTLFASNGICPTVAEPADGSAEIDPPIPPVIFWPPDSVFAPPAGCWLDPGPPPPLDNPLSVLPPAHADAPSATSPSIAAAAH